MNVLLTFGSQLFSPQKYLPKLPVIMIEHRDLCTYHKFHKHKIAFFISAMRHYRDELIHAGFSVHYLKLSETDAFQSYERALISLLDKHEVTQLTLFEIEDKFMEQRMQALSLERKMPITTLPSPNFLTTRASFKAYLQSSKRPFMKTFYEQQRKRLNILVTQELTPEGGQWSFDVENRKPLSKNQRPPSLPSCNPDLIDQEALGDTEKHFPDHPGDTNTFWLPTHRIGAQHWLKQFILERLELFGPFEDAFEPEHEVLYHSCMTPFLNIGLVNPDEVVTLILAAYREKNLPLNSVEGYIRQIIGWREFIRGIYQNYSETQKSTNFFNHQRLLAPSWYSGQTGCPPLDEVIKKTLKLAWCHHIERLMVVSNMMNLCEIHPQSSYSWFMELFVDSSDWVMGPNVYGMGLMSDGGIFATKPYICGSNYWLKMSSYKKADWCLEVDGLYWRFVREKFSFLRKNPRLSMMTKSYEKMTADKKETLEKAAQAFLQRNTRN